MGFLIYSLFHVSLSWSSEILCENEKRQDAVASCVLWHTVQDVDTICWSGFSQSQEGLVVDICNTFILCYKCPHFKHGCHLKMIYFHYSNGKAQPQDNVDDRHRAETRTKTVQWWKQLLSVQVCWFTCLIKVIVKPSSDLREAFICFRCHVGTTCDRIKPPGKRHTINTSARLGALLFKKKKKLRPERKYCQWETPLMYLEVQLI